MGHGRSFSKSIQTGRQPSDLLIDMTAVSAFFTVAKLCASKCREMLAEHNGHFTPSSNHVALVHTLQQGQVEDPWLHLEWAQVLIMLGRGSEAGRHFQVGSHDSPLVILQALSLFSYLHIIASARRVLILFCLSSP